MRLFLAVYPPAEALASLESALPEADRSIRWLSVEQWHITLAFLGEVAEPVVPRLTERLGRAAGRTPPIALALRGASTFPKQARRGRTLWCGIEGETETLIRLAERCAAAARREGIELEDRTFHPHLTLARARGTHADMTGAVAALAAYDGPPWTAGELVLVRSHLGPPLRHEPLSRWPLSGHQA